MSYAIVSTGDPLSVACATCKGTGTIGDRYCWTCNGDGASYVDQSDLLTLSHNLTVAAGLERAFELGEARNSHRTCALEGPTDCPWFWSPGCGREAPR